MDNRNPYKVPEGYFQNLQNSILTKVAKGEEYHSSSEDILELEFKARANTRTRVRIANLMGFAAGFALLVGLAMGGFNLIIDTTSQSQEDNMALFSSLELDDELLYGIDDEHIIEVLVENNSNSDKLYAEVVAEFVDLHGMVDTDVLF